MYAFYITMLYILNINALENGENFITNNADLGFTLNKLHLIDFLAGGVFAFSDINQFFFIINSSIRFNKAKFAAFLYVLNSKFFILNGLEIHENISG